MPHRRIIIALAVAAATLAVLAAPAAAAPPPNDTLDTATAITSFPFSERIAITEAGTEPFDAQLAPVCTDGAAEHTIWYRFDATAEASSI